MSAKHNAVELTARDIEQVLEKARAVKIKIKELRLKMRNVVIEIERETKG